VQQTIVFVIIAAIQRNRDSNVDQQHHADDTRAVKQPETVT